jgi:hypothetical protein
MIVKLADIAVVLQLNGNEDQVFLSSLQIYTLEQ